MRVLGHVAVLCLLANVAHGATTSPSQPEYCDSVNNANTAACFATNPDYCGQASNANSGACFQADPGYCKNEWSSRAVRAKKTEHLSCFDFEIELFHTHDGAKVLGELLGLDRDAHRAALSAI